MLLDAHISDTSHTGIDMATRSVVVELRTDQSIWITGNRTQSFGDLYQLSSFKGFYLSPTHGINYAWSIYSPTPGTAFVTLLNAGNLNVNFDYANGIASVTIPFSGI